jgi:hypothetical protein
VCFLFSLLLLFKILLILRRIKRDIIINVKTSSCKVPVIFVGLYWKFNSLNIFFKKSSNIKFHQNPSSGSRVFPRGPMDRRKASNMTKLIFAFRNFAESPKKSTSAGTLLDNTVL